MPPIPDAMRLCQKSPTNMRNLTLCCVLLAALASAAPAHAVIGTIDQVPAATLLLPYFEVDLDDPSGVTTLFSINNASATAILTHVVIWSDLSVPVLDFNCYLTGYDVQTINLRDVLVQGKLCQTASAGQDPTDTISPRGPFSTDINFPSCNGQLPLPAALPQLYLDHLRAALTGQFSSLLGGCAGRAFGDSVARGYVTVDTVSNCTLRFPGDAGYFVSGGLGDATDQNVLWGDSFFVTTDGARGALLVPIEASPTDPRVTVAGQYTFYGRYVGFTAVDNREPLPTNFAVRYRKGDLFDDGTCLVTWRDSKVSQGAFACNTLPAWYPLAQERLVVFDEAEHPETPVTVPVSPQPPGEVSTPFPAEAQCTIVGDDDLPVPFDFGWLLVDLNTTVTAAGNVPPTDPAAAQGWVLATMSAAGRFSVGFNAIQLDNALSPNHAPP